MLHEIHVNLHKLLKILDKKYRIREITAQNAGKVAALALTDPEIRQNIPQKYLRSIVDTLQKGRNTNLYVISRALLDMLGEELWSPSNIHKLNELTDKYSYKAIAEMVSERLGQRVSRGSVRTVITTLKLEKSSPLHKSAHSHVVPPHILYLLQHMHPDLTRDLRKSQPMQVSTTSNPATENESYARPRKKHPRQPITAIVQKYGVTIQEVHRFPDIIKRLEDDPRVTKNMLKNLKAVVKINEQVEKVCKHLGIPPEPYLLASIPAVGLYDMLAKKLAQITRNHDVPEDNLLRALHETGFAPREINRVQIYLRRERKR